MPQPTAPHKDLMLLQILRLMRRKNARPRDIIEGTGLGKNLVYEYLGGKRIVLSDSLSKIYAFLTSMRARKGRRRVKV